MKALYKVKNKFQNLFKTQKENLKGKSFLKTFTLNKFIAALFTITTIASVKYGFSGNLTFYLSDFTNNVGIGLLGWTVNTAILGWLTDNLGLKGNINLHELWYGIDKAKLGDRYYILEDIKPQANAMNSGEGSSSGPNYNSGGIPHNPSRSSGSGISELSEVEYWKSQLKIYEDALSALNKSSVDLTADEKYAKNQISRLGEFNKESIENTMQEIHRNISFPTQDPEAVRLENLRLTLTRQEELRRDAPALFRRAENLRLISSAKVKLEALAEYNRKNGAQWSINRLSETYKETLGVDPLTDAELKSVVDQIKNDPTATQALKDKVADGKISGKININHPIIKYIESLEKK